VREIVNENFIFRLAETQQDRNSITYRNYLIDKLVSFLAQTGSLKEDSDIGVINKFTEKIVRLVPQVIKGFRQNSAKLYQLAAAESAIERKEAFEFFTNVGAKWPYWNKDVVIRLVEVEDKLIEIIPRSFYQYDNRFITVITEHIQKKPSLFGPIANYADKKMIDVALASDSKNIQFVSYPSLEQQFDAVTRDPFNLKYIKNPGDAVIAVAAHNDARALECVKTFSSSYFEKSMKAMIKYQPEKRKLDAISPSEAKEDVVMEEEESKGDSVKLQKTH
jgi:hypothetical protein